jgi:hypothetical protein
LVVAVLEAVLVSEDVAVVEADVVTVLTMVLAAVDETVEDCVDVKVELWEDTSQSMKVPAICSSIIRFNVYTVCSQVVRFERNIITYPIGLHSKFTVSPGN